MTEKWNIVRGLCEGCYSLRWQVWSPEGHWSSCFDYHHQAVEYVDERLAAAYL